MTYTGLAISELSIAFADLRGWLEAPPKGTPPPQGITRELVLKGVASVFEVFDVLQGAPGFFPLQSLFSGSGLAVARRGLAQRKWFRRRCRSAFLASELARFGECAVRGT